MAAIYPSIFVEQIKDKLEIKKDELKIKDKTDVKQDSDSSLDATNLKEVFIKFVINMQKLYSGSPSNYRTIATLRQQRYF